MTTEQVLVALAIAAAVILLASRAWVWRALKADEPASTQSVLNPLRTPRESAARSPQSGQPCARHIWLIAAREETAGRPRAIFRCSECGALEVREVV